MSVDIPGEESNILEETVIAVDSYIDQTCFILENLCDFTQAHLGHLQDVWIHSVDIASFVNQLPKLPTC